MIAGAGAFQREIEDRIGHPGPFWNYVDSNQGWVARHHDYATQRDDQCLAMNSYGEQCNGLGVEGSPFCGRHLDRAVDWMLRQAPIHTLERFRDAVDAVREAHHVYAGVAAAIQRATQDTRVQHVYFYLLPAADLVKIGTSIDVDARITAFKSGSGCAWPDGASPEGGRLLGAIPGTRALERELHRALYDYRVKGTEWFRYAEPVSAAIADLLAGSERRAA